MLVSTKGRYAMRLMTDVARYQCLGPVPLRDVAERENISVKYLEQLARPLVHSDLLHSTRGKGGGYRLTRPASEIKAGDILRAAEGTTIPVACNGLLEDCPRTTECASINFWVGLDRVIEDYVDAVTLADIIVE
ncbi:Cysteine metabolism repressor [Slackia heliotrinireducens]|jgi:Rrf2 family protein|uniref:Rrf2 family protein, putative transcriptional regulator n=1 Tax=Slackia heliotrinireducens (strain ATCC 29202 / DSM 20476 / NCTC 11029 / RHS 1) TaxID=471855 RepID=C7N3F2_SLAHD|nr:Rrf2 family transcriptional regulator [Slackia heliotrinireducens]ACV23675.1 rrf2 family protein, putative transcriptional regulator [Slackia heliotrinireducens DSM 20476]VEH03217.1 Cysteine metabolism repressor [Slackia heliotrinireducens]